MLFCINNVELRGVRGWQLDVRCVHVYVDQWYTVNHRFGHVKEAFGGESRAGGVSP